jgi:glutaminyl-peptide cyclotransferase
MRQGVNAEFMTKKLITILILGACLVLLRPATPEAMGGEKYSQIIWNYLETLCGFGPRNPGSEGYQETLELIRRVGKKYADQVVEQPFLVQVSEGKKIRMVNLELQFAGTEGGAPIVIGSHFDTRPFADQETDPEKQIKPILGANDGGSSTAVLLALAHYLFQHPAPRPIHLVFFDGEDYGARGSGLNLLGSTHYAQSLLQVDRKSWPYWVLIIDMIGDKDLQIFKETYSLKGSSHFLDRIYSIAEKQKNSSFKSQSKYTIFDDHYPFYKMGIPATVLIDFDYPYWHTQEDTLDKCSPESMFSVFSVVTETIQSFQGRN